MATGKIVFLLVLLAICVALSYAKLWMERRSRAAAVIQLVSRTRRPPPFQCRARLDEFPAIHMLWDINLR
jgi:hypothetical protein